MENIKNVLLKIKPDIICHHYEPDEHILEWGVIKSEEAPTCYIAIPGIILLSGPKKLNLYKNDTDHIPINGFYLDIKSDSKITSLYFLTEARAQECLDLLKDMIVNYHLEMNK